MQRSDSHASSFCRLVLSILIFFALFPCFGSRVFAAGRLQKTDGPVVVVIDPGHGGDNNGTTENGFLEKEMTMTTAKAMYEELSQFENVEVYLTHWGDEDLSLKERAKYAAEKKADFLISLHYNASETHMLYGSEVWISLFPDYHNYGYQLATEFMRQFRDMGMHLRGIKTRPHSNGKDYYGLIREAVALEIPAMIVEHCHVDHETDSQFCDSEEELMAFGIADAHAVAKYFGLKSSVRGIDYSLSQSFPEVTSGVTVKRAMHDETPPEECSIELKSADYENCVVTVLARGRDSDSNLIDYAYSLDGGIQYSQRLPWPDGDILTGMFGGEAELTIEIPEGTDPELCIVVYNPYDLKTESNHVRFERAFQRVEESPILEESEVFEDATASLLPTGSEALEKSASVSLLIDISKLLLPAVGILFLICLIGFFILQKRS